MTDDIIPYPREKLIDIIDDIVYNENRKIVSIFKDYLIYDDIGDFLNRMYTIPEVKPRLNRITDYYCAVGPFNPSMAALEEQKFITKNHKLKQRKLEAKLKALEKLNKKEDSQFSYEFDSLERHKVFDTQMVEAILGESLSQQSSNFLQSHGCSIGLSMKSYEQNSKMLNNTNNKSDIYDLDVFRNPYNKDGTNSFENLVKEFVENYTDLDLSEEIIKRPRNDRKSNYNNIKVPESSYLDFDSSISIIQKHQEKKPSKKPTRGESKNNKNQTKISKRNTNLNEYIPTKPSTTGYSRRTQDSIKIEDLIKARRPGIYGTKIVKKIKEIPHKSLKYSTKSSKRVTNYDRKKYLTSKPSPFSKTSRVSAGHSKNSKPRKVKRSKKLSMKAPRNHKSGDCDPLFESKFNIMSTSAKSKLKQPKTENKRKKRNRKRIGSLDEFKVKMYLSKHKGKYSRPYTNISKTRKAPGRLSKASSYISLIGSQTSSQPDSIIKTLKQRRIRVDIRSNGRKSAYNLHKHSTHYDIRIPTPSDLRDYLTFTNLNTPTKRHPPKPKTRLSKHPKNPTKLKTSENPHFSTRKTPTVSLKVQKSDPKMSLNPSCSNLGSNFGRPLNIQTSTKNPLITLLPNNTTSSFDPSIPDEANYSPSSSSFSCTDLPVDEGSIEGNKGLVKGIQQYKFCVTSHSPFHRPPSHLPTPTTPSPSFPTNPICPQPLQSTINLKAFRNKQPSQLQSTAKVPHTQALKSCFEEPSADQQGFFRPKLPESKEEHKKGIVMKTSRSQIDKEGIMLILDTCTTRVT
ncbi:unnamed protein product [Moneuplotes crassus]|uniref:Uncharacterized protein n=1 Tax=Euplotes crassus TaxID=5936 RepID=A0AAD1Y270_EUPCR|nr:unnamed protein product [Moneuplotes crassus]